MTITLNVNGKNHQVDAEADTPLLYVLRNDLDLELTYRFIRDTVWVAVGWYRPGGKLTHDVIARQYLSILLEGIHHRA